MFVHLVPAYYEPNILGTLTALLGSRYPHGRLHVVVATRAEEELTPHPLMGSTTAELVPPRPAPRPANSVLENAALKAAGLLLLRDHADPLRELVSELSR